LLACSAQEDEDPVGPSPVIAASSYASRSRATVPGDVDFPLLVFCLDKEKDEVDDDEEEEEEEERSASRSVDDIAIFVILLDVDVVERGNPLPLVEKKSGAIIAGTPLEFGFEVEEEDLEGRDIF